MILYVGKEALNEHITSMTNAEAYEILTGQKVPMTKGAADIAVLGKKESRRRADKFSEH